MSDDRFGGEPLRIRVAARFAAVLRARTVTEREVAWAALVAEGSPFLLFVTAKRGFVDDAAKEILADVWSRLFEHRHRIESPSAVLAWLLTTLQNRIREEKRRLGHKRTTEEPIDDHDPVDESGASPEDTLRSAEIQDLLAEAISRRDERCQRFIECWRRGVECGWKGYSYADIAEEMGCPPGTVSPTIRRCLGRLFDDLRGMGF